MPKVGRLTFKPRKGNFQLCYSESEMGWGRGVKVDNTQTLGHNFYLIFLFYIEVTSLDIKISFLKKG
jgi:hypothetical protein